MQPFCTAKPSMKTLVAMLSPIRFTAADVPAMADRRSALTTLRRVTDRAGGAVFNPPPGTYRVTVARREPGLQPEPNPFEGQAAATTGDANAVAWFGALKRFAPWLLLAIGLAVSFAWWRSRSQAAVADAEAAPPASPSAPSLAAALTQGDLAAIAQALCREAGSQGDDLDAVRMRLDDAAQAEAVERLQAARWGTQGDPQAALAALRRAFAKGPRWRKPERKAEALLPPLYPE